MIETPVQTSCYHCGDNCSDRSISIAGKYFCCTGCKSVYFLLNKNNLDHYYCLNDTPGNTMKEVQPGRFRFLDEPEIANKIISFRNKERSQVTFYLPAIHCNSCLWLLENLNKVDSGILDSRVNFSNKEVTLSFLNQDLSLKQVAELLTNIGYEPHISADADSADKDPVYSSRKAAYKLGVTGFCFANIMLISFPEYLGMKAITDPELSVFFRSVNLVLALPVVLYGAREFFRNGFYSIRQGYLNIDAPIALAIAVTFIRSLYEILSGTGAGYLDSMSGIVFFMLLGRTLQNRTYSTLCFDRDYKSYFPIAITVLEDGREAIRSIKDIKEDDLLRLHHQEIIPTDCTLSKGNAEIDYSFITGEEAREKVLKGDILYAGGKVYGTGIEAIAIKAFSQNSFTRLWNNEIFSRKKNNRKSISESISRYFSLTVFVIAAVTFLYWIGKEPSYAWKAATAVLIIACPCALLLSATFTNGYLIRYFSSEGFFVKNARTIEQLAVANYIAFDKTGTLSETRKESITTEHLSWCEKEKDVALSLLAQSIHPLSIALCKQFPGFRKYKIGNYREIPGMGIEAWIQDRHIKAGNAAFVTASNALEEGGSAVWVSINGVIKAHFLFSNNLRAGVKELIENLRGYKMTLISGDNTSSKIQMQHLFPKGTPLLYHQSPEQKLEYVRMLQQQGNSVLMIGDGLNDAGALQQSDIGIAVAQHSFAFSPACDAIINASAISNLHRYIQMAKKARKLIIAGFCYSACFNLAGLFFAVRAELSPVIAAILMPASSFGIMLIANAGIRLIVVKTPFSNHDKNHTPG